MNITLAIKEIEENLVQCCIEMNILKEINTLTKESVIRIIAEKHCAGRIELVKTLINKIAREKIIALGKGIDKQ